jgi:hypothetical protein
MLLASLLISSTTNNTAYIARTYEDLRDIENAMPASVSIGKARGERGRENRYVAVRVWYMYPIKDLKGTTDQVAAFVLATDPPISETDDILSVVVFYGYDIGIGSYWHGNNEAMTPAEWKARIKYLNVEE